MSSTMSQLPVRQHSAGSLLRPYFQHWMPSTKSCVPPRSLVPQVNAYANSLIVFKPFTASRASWNLNWALYRVRRLDIALPLHWLDCLYSISTLTSGPLFGVNYSHEQKGSSLERLGEYRRDGFVLGHAG